MRERHVGRVSGQHAFLGVQSVQLTCRPDRVHGGVPWHRIHQQEAEVREEIPEVHRVSHEAIQPSGPDATVCREHLTFINVGKLKANNDNQNYDIPASTDLSKYDTILIWCRPFSVLW